jgi:hypothetical protein
MDEQIRSPSDAETCMGSRRCKSRGSSRSAMLSLRFRRFRRHRAPHDEWQARLRQEHGCDAVLSECVSTRPGGAEGLHYRCMLSCTSQDSQGGNQRRSTKKGD